MWLTDLPRLLSHLADLTTAIREQNQLQRELIRALTHKSPTTPSSTTQPRQQLRREYTGADHFRVTRETTEAQVIKSFEATHRPWRPSMSDLPTLLEPEIDQPINPPIRPPTSANSPARPG